MKQVSLVPRDLDHVIAHHERVRAHLTPGQDSFILPRDRSYFENILSPETDHTVLAVKDGTVIAAKAVVVLDENDEHALLQALTVDPDYRGIGLTRMLLNAWTDYAREKQRKFLAAEIEIHNLASIGVFLKAGLSLTHLLQSPVDGATVYTAETRLKYRAVKRVSADQKQTGDVVTCPFEDYDRQSVLMRAGYVVTGMDSTRGYIMENQQGLPVQKDSVSSA